MRVCKDCDDLFEPKLPKQWYCYPCRNYVMERPEDFEPDYDAVDLKVLRKRYVPTFNVPLHREIYKQFKSLRQAAMDLGIPSTTLRCWIVGNRPTGKDRVNRLCKAIKKKPEDVFSRSVIDNLK